MKNFVFISEVVAAHNTDLEKDQNTIVLLDRIDVSAQHSIVLCYWPWKHEYATWDMFCEPGCAFGETGDGHYFSSEKCDVNGRMSGLKAAADDLYYRAKKFGWKPNRKAARPKR